LQLLHITFIIPEYKPTPFFYFHAGRVKMFQCYTA